ncbi:hypothetical protein SLA2020_368250 [Shorea laevis]
MLGLPPLDRAERRGPAWFMTRRPLEGNHVQLAQLVLYYASGRLWRSEESGRPYVKCNDSLTLAGSKFIESPL